MLATWNIVVRRVVSDRLMFVAAAVTVLLSVTVLAASPIYSDAVSLSSLHRVLENGESGSNLEVVSRTRGEHFESQNLIVREQVARSFSLTGAEIYTKVRGSAHELPIESDDDLVNMASIQFLEEIESRAGLVAGSWAVAGAEPLEVTVHAEAASLLGLGIGDELMLTNRHTPAIQTPVRVVGLFIVDDLADTYWHDDAILESGVEESASFRYYGPFVVALDTVLGDFAFPNADMRWRVLPHHQLLTVADIPEQGGAAASLAGLLNEQVTVGGNEFRVTTELATILMSAEQSIAATRSSVLMLSVQLAILAGFALMQTAGLLVDSRRTETGLLRARGSGNGQILSLAVMEGILLTIPAIVLAPPLAALMLRSLNVVGPLAGIGLMFQPEINSAAYILAVVAAAVCIAALAVPAYRSSRTFNESLVAGSRQQLRSTPQMIGLDIALLVFAVAVFWQLATNGVQLGSSLRGRLSFDPLLVAAPALGLLAGAILALRVVPLLARLAERIAASKRSTVPALSAWQVARRPRRYARSALLLIIAVSIGFFVASYTATWTRSQVDQAAFQIGADLRLIPGRGTGTLPDFYLRASHESIEGVVHSMPVLMTFSQLVQRGAVNRFFYLDPAVATEVVAMPDDRARAEFGELMDQLVETRRSLPGFELPGEPRWVGVQVAVESEKECAAMSQQEYLDAFFPDGVPADFPEDFIDNLPEELFFTCLEPSLSLLLRDAHGSLHHVELGEVPVNADPVLVGAQIVSESGLTPGYPLSVVAVEMRTPVPGIGLSPISGRFSGEIVVGDAPDGADATQVALAQDIEVAHIGGGPMHECYNELPAATVDTGAPNRLEFDFDPGIGCGFDGESQTAFTIRPRGEMPTEIPVVVTNAFLAESGSEVGDIVNLERFRISGRIIGAIESFPTVPSDGTGVIADLGTAQLVSHRPGQNPGTASEFWLSVEPGSESNVVAGLRGGDFNSLRIQNRSAGALALGTDPMALSTMAALSLGFVVAAVFAVIGFTVSTVVLARERRSEITLMRALGLTGRQLRSWLLGEQAATVLVALLFGSLVGYLLARVILPLITVTQSGEVPVPVPVVVIPMATIVTMQLIVVGVLAVIVLGLVAVLRRRDLAANLRMGDD